MPNSPRLSGFDHQRLITDFRDHLVEGVEERLAAPVPGFESLVDSRPRFPLDKWILSSAVQKLIRRGLPDQAVKTALALHKIDPAYLPRRLPIIAFEDIGLGNLGACFDTLYAFGNQRSPTTSSEPERLQVLLGL